MYKTITHLLINLFIIFSLNGCVEKVHSIIDLEEPNNPDQSYSKWGNPSFQGGSANSIKQLSKVYSQGTTEILTTEKYQNGIANDFYGNLLISPVASDKDNFDRLYQYHSSVISKTNLIFNNSQSPLNKVLKNQSQLDKLILGEEKFVRRQNQKSSLDSSFRILESIIQTIHKAKDKLDSKLVWKSNCKPYQKNLRHILNNEFRVNKLLEIPTLVSFFLLNENPNNLKRGYVSNAKNTIGIFVKKYLERINTEYNQRNSFVNSVLNSTLYSIAYFEAREGQDRAGIKRQFISSSNIHEIRNFSKEKINVEWISLNKTSEQELNANKSYQMLDIWLPKIQQLSISRDVYHTLINLNQNYFVISGFDAAFF